MLMVQLFVQIILGGTLFELPKEFKFVNMFTISYWTTDGMGSTVDLVQLNNESRTCVASPNPENPENPNEFDVNKPLYVCAEATRELALDYKHTPQHVRGMWMGSLLHAFLWFLATIIVQARAKGD